MRRAFNKMMQLFAFLAVSGATSSSAFKGSEKGKKESLARFSQDNFSSLSMKRVKGKWRVRA